MTWRFQQIKPQKARGVLRESLWTDPEWVAEEKYDGDRRIAQFFADGRVRYTGTRESVSGRGFVEKTHNLPHLANASKSLDGTVLDGEIVAPFAKNLPGGKSKYVTRIMGSSPEEAVRKQREHGWLEYMVFDCLWWKGKDVRNNPLIERVLIAYDVLCEWKNAYAKQVRQVGVKGRKAYFDSILASGGEGVVLKSIHHTYGDEKLWVKVKGEWTADVVVTGFVTGKGKYANTIGALKFAQWAKVDYAKTLDLVEMGTCSGFDDALRAEMDASFKKFRGRVFEIKHNGRETTGAFRHPRFSRWRPDKDPRECVYREDET